MTWGTQALNRAGLYSLKRRWLPGAWQTSIITGMVGKRWIRHQCTLFFTRKKKKNRGTHRSGQAVGLRQKRYFSIWYSNKSVTVPDKLQNKWTPKDITNVQGVAPLLAVKHDNPDAHSKQGEAFTPASMKGLVSTFHTQLKWPSF